MRPLRIARRTARWITGADCTCGKRTAPDFLHAPGCKHILLKGWHHR